MSSAAVAADRHEQQHELQPQQCGRGANAVDAHEHPLLPGQQRVAGHGGRGRDEQRGGDLLVYSRALSLCR